MEVSRIVEKNDIIIETQATSAFLTTVKTNPNQTHYVPKGIVIVAERDTLKALHIVTIPKDNGTPNAGRFMCSLTDEAGNSVDVFPCDAIRLYADTIDGEPGYRVSASSFMTTKNPWARFVTFFKSRNVIIGDAVPDTQIQTVSEFKE